MVHIEADGSRTESGRINYLGKVNTTDPYLCDDDSNSDEDAGEQNKDDKGGSVAPGGTTLTKAQARRAQVRRAQVQHRKRKADYLRQLEVDVSTLRDLVSATEKETRRLRHENASIRVRLGISVVGSGKNNIIVPSKIDSVISADTSQVMALDVPAVAVSSLNDVTVGGDIGQLLSPSAPEVSPATTPWDVSTITTGPSPMSLSSSASPAAQGVLPIALADTIDAKVDATGSLFANIDLDDITVALVMDEFVGTPVYHISSSSVSTSSPPYDENSAVLQSFPTTSITTSPAYNSMTTSAIIPMDPALVSDASSPVSPEPGLQGYSWMQEMTLEQVHVAVNFILALEYVCWNHVGHQFCRPNTGVPHAGHTLMASNLLLQHASDKVHMDVYDFNDKYESEINDQAGHTHDTSFTGSNDNHAVDLTWQAPDVTLQQLYGLATSLNPASDKELTPIEAWFELASNYPLSILLRQDVIDELKRGFSGVVRCLYFGAVIERQAFESVVDRILGPIMSGEAAIARIQPAEHAILAPQHLHEQHSAISYDITHGKLISSAFCYTNLEKPRSNPVSDGFLRFSYHIEYRLASKPNNWVGSAGAGGFDLRSDTMTTPTASMLAAIHNTTLLDDVLKEDQTTIDLEAHCAKLTGKEAGLLVLSGTMGNQVALRALLKQPPHSVLCDRRSHIFTYEAGGLSSLSGAMIIPVQAKNGIHLTLEEVKENAVLGDDIHGCPTRVISLENTLNGMIMPLDEVRRISDWARSQGILMHCDGARLWEAAASGAGSLVAYSACFDTVTMCFSKGLGAPIGSIIVGPKAVIKHANWIRKSIGGGLRQSGVVSAAARVAVNETFGTGPNGEGGLLQHSHGLAFEVAKMWTDRGGKMRYPVHTNMAWLDFPASGVNEELFAKLAAAEGLKMYSERIIVHYQIYQNRQEVVPRLERLFTTVLDKVNKVPVAGAVSSGKSAYPVSK
ncbi:alanine racemase [Grosmannia clavigera kw1407]|uniref:Alanine racemase n=1 Tax=Grosmannia clavigera (strain kw1407 / UAMH 11150) TaxID=655863 RepID=F0X9E4_GROCL|nr:alanine racemase [Grosmannia clavigera kw1407]EFX05284.1 alanine racemase [Grosmannia clavigera kw1407]